MVSRECKCKPVPGIPGPRDPIEPEHMNTKQILVLTGGIVLLTGTIGCKDGSRASAPASAPPAVTTAAASASGFSGKVVETMNTAGYTYVLVDTGTEKLWAAAPQFEVKAGDSVDIRGGNPMHNYHSKTLNRDFEVVYFTGNVSVNGLPAGAGALGTKLLSGQPPLGGQGSALPEGHPPVGGGAAKPKMELTGIKKADGGKTIEEIFAGKANLTGKEVKVRGRVVKYNANIMGKNWLHIQDGTGAAGSDDLLLTTASPVKVGDTVLATGTVLTDKDFGYGYKYAVMIDDAKLVIE